MIESGCGWGMFCSMFSYKGLSDGKGMRAETGVSEDLAKVG
jgi:hypothetical protein